MLRQVLANDRICLFPNPYLRVIHVSFFTPLDLVYLLIGAAVISALNSFVNSLHDTNNLLCNTVQFFNQ